jgi:capsular polysaccharide biosynthesis protein
VNLRPLIRFLRTSWLLIAVFAIVGIAMAGGYLATQTPRYEATAKLYVSVESMALAHDLSQGSSFTGQVTESYAKVATAPMVLDPVISALRLKETASSLRERVLVTVPPDQAVLLVRATDPSPVGAARIANAISRQLVKTGRTLTPSGPSGPEVRLTQVQLATPPPSPSVSAAPVVLALGLLMGAALGVLAASGRDRFGGGGGMRALTPRLT